MLNLLFISDSPKAQYVKSVLQPVLKVIIDVVTDFDHGLKDVFEKRPSTVCIQDQIGGVTGESVARHIQMLLGDNAPTFILLYSGDDKPKVLTGLYEHIIDLSQSDDTVAENIFTTLKLLMGTQWDKICISPQLTPTANSMPLTVSEDAGEEADKLLDDFFSDTGSSNVPIADKRPDVVSPPVMVSVESVHSILAETRNTAESSQGSAESDRAQSINDDLAELLLMEVDKIRRDERDAAVASAGSVIPKYETPELKQSPPVITKLSVSPEIFSETIPLEKVAVFTDGFKKNTSNLAPAVASTTPPAAEFRVNNKYVRAEDSISEELLLAFEDNYRSESTLLRRIVVVAFICTIFAALGWYLIKQNPQLISSFRQRLPLLIGVKQSPAKLPVAVLVPPPVQKPTLASVLPMKTTPQLPSFIPKDGRDSSFAFKNPGWERYVGKLNEFRVFSTEGHIQAVQVIAGKDAAISESLIVSVLQEFVGSSKYQIKSRNTKSGVRVDSGIIQNKGEVKFYRRNGSVKAFVVTVH